MKLGGFVRRADQLSLAAVDARSRVLHDRPIAGRTALPTTQTQQARRPPSLERGWRNQVNLI